MRNKKQSPVKTCTDCIHEDACKCWTCGRVLSPENAARYPAFETVKDSAAYYIGFLDGQEAKYGTNPRPPMHWIHINDDCVVCSACLNASPVDYYYCPEYGAPRAEEKAGE